MSCVWAASASVLPFAVSGLAVCGSDSTVDSLAVAPIHAARHAGLLARTQGTLILKIIALRFLEIGITIYAPVGLRYVCPVLATVLY